MSRCLFQLFLTCVSHNHFYNILRITLFLVCNYSVVYVYLAFILQPFSFFYNFVYFWIIDFRIQRFMNFYRKKKSPFIFQDPKIHRKVLRTHALYNTNYQVNSNICFLKWYFCYIRIIRYAFGKPGIRARLLEKMQLSR